MKTLADFSNYYECIYPKVKLGRELMEHNLHTVLSTFNSKQPPTFTITNKGVEKCSINITFKGINFTYDRIIDDIYRIYNMYIKSPGSIPISQLNTFELFKWMSMTSINWLDLLNNPMGRAALFQFSQVAEKTISLYNRKLLNIGIVNGQFMKGKDKEVFQAEEFERNGGKAIITSANNKTIDFNTGNIINYQKSKRKDSSKQLDLQFEGNYVRIYTTNKAHTAELDGGGRTTEYEHDLGTTLQKWSDRSKNGYEMRDRKVVLFIGLIDSRFFAGTAGPNAIRNIQSKINNIDTFLCNSATLAKFMNLIDVQNLLIDPTVVIANAFNSLAVDV